MNLSTETLSNELKAQLLTPPQVTRLAVRITEITTELTQFNFSGTPEETNQQIAMYQFMKGKLDAFQELILDHDNAVQTLAQAQNQPQPN